MQIQFVKNHNFRLNPRPGLVVLFALVIATMSMPAMATEPGQKAPIFSGKEIAGTKEISLSDYRGKVVYVDFWASWCPPCLKSIPELEKLRVELPKQSFQILAVNLDKKPKKALKFLAKNPVGYPSLSNPKGDIPEKFGLETMPTSYLIDEKGVVRYIHRGYRPGDLEIIRKEVRKIMR